MRTISTAATTVLFLTSLACQSSSPSTTSATTDSDTESDETDDSETVSVTLTGPTTDPDTGTTAGTDATETSATTDATETTDATDPSADSSTTDPSTSGTDPTDTSSSGGAEESSTGEQLGNTIYEIQDGTIPEDQPVEVYNVIVTAVTPSGFFAQEPAGGEYSGVIVYSANNGPDTSAVAIGDIVDFSGNTFEFNGEITEVVITDGTFNIVGPGVPLDPEVVDISVFGAPDTAEPWEAVLVRVEGPLVVTDNITMFDEFVVTDGDSVTIDNFLYNLPESGDFAGFDVGAAFSAIQGPVNFWIDDYKIAPRSADDVEGYEAP